MERQIPNGGGFGDGVDAIEAEVARARLSFEEGLREASVVGTRAARRMVTPALIGVGLAGGALVVLALVRLARRPADGALIRIVVETPRAPQRVLPALGTALARWLLERQLRGRGPLAALVDAVMDPQAGRGQGHRSIDSTRGVAHYES